MSSNRARDTSPELALRRELRRRGLRGYRLYRTSIPGRPDLSFGPERLAIFVHGCFWHRCPRCNLPLPKSHTDFWRAKFTTNRRRDVAKARMLQEAGWKVLILWECEVREDPGEAAQRVEKLLGRPT